MKKFCIWLIVFFVAVMVIDLGFGAGCRYFITHAKAGYTKTREYVANHCNEDILIMGSSRALHHYVPEIIKDSLGLTCYNCGVGGNGILYHYSQFLMIKNRYLPKVIIYDVLSDYDLLQDDYSRYLGWQKRYCDIPGVMNVIADINATEPIKLKCNLYKYSGNFVQMAADNIHSFHNQMYFGYEPYFSVMDYEPESNNEPKRGISWDSKKKKYFEKLVDDCRTLGITIIFAYSPSYGARGSYSYSEFTEFCKIKEVKLIDYYAQDGFSNNRLYFVDSGHMNDEGAREYTKHIIKEIKSEITRLK